MSELHAASEVPPLENISSLREGHVVTVSYKGIGTGSVASHDVSGTVAVVGNRWVEFIPLNTQNGGHYAIKFTSAHVGMLYYDGSLLGPVQKLTIE
jgi:hypothetical protein